MTSAFFYGILIHPKILKRALNNDASHLRFSPAILTGYTRHKVKFADYPAIVPSEQSKVIFGRELTQEENNVRGSLVAGLTEEDIRILDVLEGDEYVRSQVSVHPLGPFTPFPADAASTSEAVEEYLIPVDFPTLPSAGELVQPITAETYVWGLDSSALDKELWSFDEFAGKNAWKLIGEGAQSNEKLWDVDKVRERLRAGNGLGDA